MPDDDRDDSDQPDSVRSVSVDELARRLDAGEPVRLLDVRDRDEVEQWRIDGPDVTATQLPYAKFLQAQVTDTVEELADDVAGEGPIVAVCGRGEASDYVAGLLAEAGVDAANLDGGMTAWARRYEATEIDAGGEATVVQYRRPSSGCLAYLIVSGDEAVVVDPLRAFADRYAADAAEYGADLVAAVDTHVHADHVSGVRAVADATGAERVLPDVAADRGITFDVRTVGDGDEIAVGDASLRAVALPGHTTGMTGFAVGDVLLTGDSVFVDGLARPDLQDGAAGTPDLAATLYETVTERLAAFDDGTVIAPGHYDDATDRAHDGTLSAPLGAARERLAAYGGDRDTFVERVLAGEPPRPANAERIVAVNLGRESVDDETAFELELGPNNCAAAAPST